MSDFQWSDSTLPEAVRAFKEMFAGSSTPPDSYFGISLKMEGGFKLPVIPNLKREEVLEDPEMVSNHVKFFFYCSDTASGITFQLNTEPIEPQAESETESDTEREEEYSKMVRNVRDLYFLLL